jgi:hemerythrin superfamily protein
MNIYNYLKKDHALVAQLFEEIINEKSSDKRKELFEEIKENLLLHSEAEHKTFYKELKNFEEIKDLIKHADKEHAEVKEYLEQISKISVEDNLWIEKIGELKHSVDHHVHEEEKEIFQTAKKLLDKDQELDLATKMEELKQKISEKI